MEQATGFRHPIRGRDEEFPFVLTAEQHQTVEPNVIDKYAVWHVAAGIFFSEFDEAIMLAALHLDERSHRFTGPHAEFWSLFRATRRLLFSRQDMHDDLRCFSHCQRL